MSGRAKVLSWQARELSRDDRVALVENILESLHAADPQIDHAWMVEAKERLAANGRDDLAVRDLHEFLAKYRV